MTTPEPTQENKPETSQETKPKEQALPAVGFMVMAFTEEMAGDQALQAMIQGKKEKTFYFEEVAVIRQDATGKVHYQETGDIKTGSGAGIGPLNRRYPWDLRRTGRRCLGAGAGAALGAAMSHGDAGFRDENLNTVGLALKPGTSAAIHHQQGLFERSREAGPCGEHPRVSEDLSQDISTTTE